MSNGKHLGKGSSLPSLPNDGKLRLYSMRFCPFAQRVHLTLDAKKIEHHTIYIDLLDKPEWLPEKSPLGKVPALEIPGQKEPIIESLIIADYLDEKYPETPLHPADPLQKARDRILVERFNAFIAAYYPLIRGTAPNVSQAVRDVVAALQLYEDELRARKTKFFGGSKPGMLDYMIWPWCERSDVIQLKIGDKFELDRERFEKLLAWREFMKLEPAVKQTIISAENHFKFITGYNAGTPEYELA